MSGLLTNAKCGICDMLAAEKFAGHGDVTRPGGVGGTCC